LTNKRSKANRKTNTFFQVIENKGRRLIAENQLFRIENAVICATFNDIPYSLIGDIEVRNIQSAEGDFTQYKSTKRFRDFLSTCIFKFYNDGHLSINVSIKNCGFSSLRLGKIEFTGGDGKGEMRCKSSYPCRKGIFRSPI
jgi:hypothetical protein